MDSFERPDILVGKTTAEHIKRGHKEHGSAQERREAQQSDEHKAVMRLFGALAAALKARYQFEKVSSLKWHKHRRRSPAVRLGGRGQRGPGGVQDARIAQRVIPCPEGEAARSVPSRAASRRGRATTQKPPHIKSSGGEYIFLW